MRLLNLLSSNIVLSWEEMMKKWIKIDEALESASQISVVSTLILLPAR